MEEKKIKIGLENHILLNIENKLFCNCKAELEVCGICLGYPGMLPNINFESVEKILNFGKMIKATTNEFLMFDRKRYIYRDIPKLYQISQNEFPLLTNGKIGTIKIRQAHLEEDAGKTIGDKVDFRRAGCALIEIVTEPCLKSILEVEEYLHKLRDICLYLNLINSEKSNAIRCDVNLSINEGKRIEIKNLNSISEIKDSIEYEIQANAPSSISQTKGWDGKKTYFMREKTSYLYMPEYDLPIFSIKEISYRFKSLEEELLIPFSIFLEELKIKYPNLQNEFETLNQIQIYSKDMRFRKIFLRLEKIC